MLGRISKARHAAVLTAISGTTALTGFGVMGAGDHPERFDGWHVVVEPSGADGLRFTETIDQDFGSADRRGHQRFIPNDFGAPVGVSADSPDAPDAVSVTDLGIETRIRIGDPDVTISGQHRYTLRYVLPDADLDSGLLAVDLLEGDEFPRDRFEVVITGFELADARCFAGTAGSEAQCELTAEPGLVRAVIEPLDPFTGVTIDGTIVRRVDALAVDPPPIPERRSGNTLGLTLGVAGLSLAGAAPAYAWARRKGRNEVFAGGAAEAATGDLPAPGAAAPVERSTELVADDDLADLATIEFAPPKGLQPWEGAVLLGERLDDTAVEDWLSGLAGREAIELGVQGDALTIAPGAKRAALGEPDAALLTALLGGKDPYVTGTYDPAFQAAWSRVAAMQRERIAASGWWKHLAPGQSATSSAGAGSAFVRFAFIGFGVLWMVGAGSAVFGLLRSWPAALLAGLVFPALVAVFVYRVLLPARSAQGSALALRTESFRRFLHASEGKHVEWAWSQGLLREYSGWAVALGEADAWGKALAAANVPAPARSSAGPVVIAGRRSSITASRSKPAPAGGSSGGGGSRGGGFRGGRVGGGGGGGRGGSW